MDDKEKLLQTDRGHEVLLQCKYLSTLKKITKGITHEYNNIFTGLSGQMRIRKQEEGGVSEKRAQLIEQLLKRGMEQTEILFDISRDIESCKKPCSPGRLAGKAIDLLNTVSRLHCFHAHVEEGLPKIIANQRDILLLLFYLGENGIEAMEKGGAIRLEVSHVKQARKSSLVRFCMIDAGTGFSDEIKRRMGELFFTTKLEGNAAGIGLYAAQAIVSDHGGVFKIEREPSGGAIATVDIPVLQNDEKVGPTKLNSGRNVHLDSQLRKHVFLIVDDEEAMRELFLIRLQRRGHVVFSVASCKEAVREFRLLADTVTVILIDVGLRDACGYDCARQLRKIDENVAIILMSGMDVEEKKMLASKACFIKKPFLIEQLEQLVSDVQL